MEVLGGGGLIGKVTSLSPLISKVIPIRYVGHATRGGEALRMAHFIEPVPDVAFDTPVVLVIGTSMSAGKTTSAKVVVRGLKRMGLEVAGAKLTGAGRYRDTLVMRDAGADDILDFVDVGLPSTVVPPDEYRGYAQQMLNRIQGFGVDAVVIEAGASPLEPYNGGVAVEMLRDHIKFCVLCATDPYAAVGIMDAFHRRPDLIAGPATNTEAGIALVKALTGIRGLNVLDAAQWPVLNDMLRERFEPFD